MPYLKFSFLRSMDVLEKAFEPRLKTKWILPIYGMEIDLASSTSVLRWEYAEGMCIVSNT